MSGEWLTLKDVERLGEAEAERFILKTGRDARHFDIESYCESRLGLSIRYEEFAGKDSDKIGFLANGRELLNVERGGRQVYVRFERDTAVISSRLLPRSMNGRRRFTIAHEAAHRLLEMLALVPLGDAAYCGDDQEPVLDGSEMVRRLRSLTEEMADRLAAALLMPRRLVDSALGSINSGRGITVYGGGAITVSDLAVADAAADRLQVSRAALICRMRGLRMIEQKPAREYPAGTG